jgi:hypothetical protein
MPRDDDEPGKGAYWTVDLDEMEDFEDGMFKRRRTFNTPSKEATPQKPSSCKITPVKPQSAVKEKSLIASVIKSSFLPQPQSPKIASLHCTPLKTPASKVAAVATPKIAASCPGTWSRSPFCSREQGSAPSINNHVDALFSKRLFQAPEEAAEASKAVFWSYPELSLTDMGLEAEPPSPDGTSLSIEGLFCDAQPAKSVELFCEVSAAMRASVAAGLESKFVPSALSPLSWMLAASSGAVDDLSVFDHTQKLLSEYLQ